MKFYVKIQNIINSFSSKDKVFSKISCIMIVMFILSFINVPFTKNQEKEAEASVVVQSKIDYSDEVNTVKILEIGPDKMSKLTGEQYNYDSMPVLKEGKLSDGTKYSITYVDMPMFISMVDDIEGIYDVIVISNNGGDYTNPQTIPKGMHATANTYNNLNLKDYKSENDITKKRAKLITDMIDKGQIVYMDKDILSSELNGTNLYNIFNNINDTSNFIKTSSSNITINNVIRDYKSKGAKRPQVQKVLKPQDEIREDRKLQYTVTAKDDKPNIRIKLYLDANNDGLYKEDELKYSKDFDADSDYKDYSFYYMLSKKYIGYLGWKIDVISLIDLGNGQYKEGTKTSCYSNVISKAMDQSSRKDIKVLQIYPDDKDVDTYDHANHIKSVLTDNSNFNTMLENIDDYDIKIDSITVSNFCATYNTQNSYKDLEKKYDMLIIGFADNYNYKDFTDYNAIKSIESFIADGYSVMFTHDTISHAVNGTGTCAKLTQQLRDYVGQSRYGDPYRYKSGKFDEIDLLKEYNPETKEFITKTIPHDISKDFTLGESDYSVAWESTYSDKIKLVNSAQITDYPFNLRKDYGNKVPIHVTHSQWFQLNLEDEDVVPWYNITKGNDSINSSDSRNLYYTYSKGNITYSGTGHRGVDVCKGGGPNGSDVPIPTEELELFINTIVKAYHGGNHAPYVENSVKVIDDSGNSDEKVINNNEESPVDAKRSDDYVFYTVVSDEDLDNVKVGVSLGSVKLSNDYIELAETGEKYDGSYIPSDTKLKITVPKEMYKDKGVNSTFSIDVKATDDMEASSDGLFSVKIKNSEPDIKSYSLDAFSENNIDQDRSMVNLSSLSQLVTNGSDDFKFISIPFDADDDKMNVYITTKGLTTSYGEYSENICGKKSNDKLNIAIPKEYISGIPKGNKFTVNVTVKDVINDKETSSFTESFDVLIGNHPPEIENSEFDSTLDKYIKIDSDTDNDGINNAKFSVKSSQDSYIFLSNISDIDIDDTLKLTVYCEDNTGNDYNQVKNFEILPNDSHNIYVNIPNKYYEKSQATNSTGEDFSKYADKKRGETFKIKTVVQDSEGLKSEKIFTAQISPNNDPVIKNYEVGSDTVIANNDTSINFINMGDSFYFDILPDDLDKDKINVTVSIKSGNDVTVLTPFVNCTPGQKINSVEILKNYYKNTLKGQKFLINVFAQDIYGGNAEENFYVKINDNSAASIDNYEENGTDLIKNGEVSVNNPAVNSKFTEDSNGKYILSDDLKGDDFKFVALPKDSDDKFVNVDVSIDVDGESKFVKSYKNVEANKKMDITIPREYYKTLKRGDSFKVYVSISDHLSYSLMDDENLCETKMFTVKLKDNVAPVISNYDTNGSTIDNQAVSEAIKEKDYSFYTNIDDYDDEIVKLTVKCDNETIFSEYVEKNLNNEISIPKECYSVKSRGDKFAVTVIAEDQFGGKDEKTFEVKIKDNIPPDIRNYTVTELENGNLQKDSEILNKESGGTAKTFKDYEFITVPEDKDDEYVDVSIDVDGKNIFAEENAKSYEDINVTIPKDIYKDKATGDKVNVTVTVQDKNGGSTEKAFYLVVKANNPPEISNYYNKTNIYASNDTPSNEAVTKKTEIKNKETIYENNEENNDGYQFVTVPYDQDENDKNNLKVTVTMTIDGEENILFDKDNQVSENEINILIPKNLYKDLKPNKKINLKTTVTDLSGETATKEFDLIMNKAPEIINTDLNHNNIDNESDVNVIRYHDFKFYSICSDQDEDKYLKYEVYLENEKIVDYTLDDIDEFGHDLETTISNDKFNKLNENEKMKVTTIVTDSRGKSSEKSFYIKVINYAPEITNYKVEDINNIESQLTFENIIPEGIDDNTLKQNAIKQNKYLDYRFVSVVSDKNELETLKVSATAKLLSSNSEAKEVPVQMKSGGKEITSLDEIKSDSRVTVTVPQSVYKEALPGDYVQISTTVTDEFGAKRTSQFYLIIDNISASVSHGILQSEDKNGDIMIDTTSKRVRTYDTVKFAGKATDVYCNVGSSTSLKLIVDSAIEVKGKVTAYRISNGKKSDEWTMIYDTDSKCYKCNLSYGEVTQIGKIEPEGMTFIIRYDGLIKNKSSSNRTDFINKLYVNSIEAEVNTFIQDDDFKQLEPLF